MAEEYTLLISGYRGFQNYDIFCEHMKSVVMEIGRPKMVLQGECKTGTDQMAKRWSRENNIECMSFPAEWSKGKRAGPERNSKMLELCDAVVAFMSVKSKGTRDVVIKTRQADILLYEFDITKYV